MSDLIERLEQRSRQLREGGWQETSDDMEKAAARIRELEAATSEAINQLVDPCDACDFPSKEDALQATIAAALAALTRSK